MGTTPTPQPSWKRDPLKAARIADARCAQMISSIWNSSVLEAYWQALYKSQSKGAIIMGTTPTPQPSWNTPPTLSQTLIQQPLANGYAQAVFATAAAALTAGVPVVAPGGEGIAPYNPAWPLKGFVGSGVVNVFDLTSGELVTLTIPPENNSINLPGGLPYPLYVIAPTSAEEYGPFGYVGPMNAWELCMETDAQEVMGEILTLYPGAKGELEDTSTNGVFFVQWNGELRRVWTIVITGITSIPGVSTLTLDFASVLVAMKNGLNAMANSPIVGGGIGAPYQWELQANLPVCVFTPQVLVAPAGAITVPPPMQTLPTGFVYQYVQGTTPFGGSSWMIVNTNIQQTLAEQIAAIEAQIQQLQTQLATLQAQQGGTPPASGTVSVT